MTRISSTHVPVVSGEYELHLRSVAALAAALATCAHPELARVGPADMGSTGLAHVRWCAACGAIGAQDDQGAIVWNQSTIASLVGSAELEELANVLRELGRLREIAERHDEENAATTLATIANALGALSRSLLAKDLPRLEDAIALLRERASGTPSAR